MELAINSQQEKNLSIALNNKDKEIEIGKIIYGINLIIPYPLSDFQISDWAKCINKFIPNLKPTTLQKIVDLYVLGQLEFNSKIGIQNIFKGYVFLIDKQLSPLHQFNQTMFYKHNYDGIENPEQKIKECKEEIERLTLLKKPFEKINGSTKLDAIL